MSQPNAILEIPGKWEIPYTYSVGETASIFLLALKGGVLKATRCSKCKHVFMPPRSFCESCFVPMDEWVDLAPEGVIEAATIVTESFANMPRPPYALAYVRLTGADTALGNFITGVDLSDLGAARQRMQIGTRVRVRFKPAPEGRITDFTYEPI